MFIFSGIRGVLWASDWKLRMPATTFPKRHSKLGGQKGFGTLVRHSKFQSGAIYIYIYIYRTCPAVFGMSCGSQPTHCLKNQNLWIFGTDLLPRQCIWIKIVRPCRFARTALPQNTNDVRRAVEANRWEESATDAGVSKQWCLKNLAGAWKGAS